MSIQQLLKSVSAAALFLVAIGCSAQSGAPTATTPTIVAQAPTSAPGEFVLLYVLNGTPTRTPTPNPTDQALWATINAGTPSLTPTTPHSIKLVGTAPAVSNVSSNSMDA